MDANVITAFLVGTAGLVTIFFGRHYWQMLNHMVNTQGDELAYFREQFRLLRTRVDDLEKELHAKELELFSAMNTLDDYVGLAMKLQEENKELRTLIENVKSQMEP